jgi:hypothetical protein
MPGKMARSDPRPPFELLEVKVAVRTSRLFCRKAGKTRIFSPVQESSGESRPHPRPTPGLCAFSIERLGLRIGTTPEHGPQSQNNGGK